MANSAGSAAKSSSRRCFTLVKVTTPTAPRTPLPTKFAVAEKHIPGLLLCEHPSIVSDPKKQINRRMLTRYRGSSSYLEASRERLGARTRLCAQLSARLIRLRYPQGLILPNPSRQILFAPRRPVDFHAVNLAGIPQAKVKRQDALRQVAGLAVVVLGISLPARMNPHGRSQTVAI